MDHPPVSTESDSRHAILRERISAKQMLNLSDNDLYENEDQRHKCGKFDEEGFGLTQPMSVKSHNLPFRAERRGRDFLRSIGRINRDGASRANLFYSGQRQTASLSVRFRLYHANELGIPGLASPAGRALYGQVKVYVYGESPTFGTGGSNLGHPATMIAE